MAFGKRRNGGRNFPTIALVSLAKPSRAGRELLIKTNDYQLTLYFPIMTN